MRRLPPDMADNRGVAEALSNAGLALERSPWKEGSGGRLSRGASANA